MFGWVELYRKNVPSYGHQSIEEVECEKYKGFVEENAVDFIQCISEFLVQIKCLKSKNDKSKFCLDEYLNKEYFIDIMHRFYRDDASMK